jgi:pimeloyl-ACP methyl ester carboxylesterase
MISHNSETKDYLINIIAPTLILGGDKDPFFTEKIFKDTAKSIRNGNVAIFEGAGHMVPLEKKKEVKDAIFDFLRKS